MWGGGGLRRQALESRSGLETGKTTSRKAQSKQSSLASSAANSRAASRAGSRIPSRQPSEDEGSDDSSDNETTVSVDAAYTNAEDEPRFDWEGELRIRIEQILDRKRSSGQGREADLAAYIHMLRIRYSQTTIAKPYTDLMGAFQRSIRSETSEKETILALKAVAISVLTDTEQDSYTICSKQLKTTIADSQYPAAKAEAIHTLGMVAFFGGASTGDTSSVMDLFLEIIQSDGASVLAQDDAHVVTAALESWGFLATQLEDLESESEDATEAMIDQLESTQPSVQISAGENIALLYEKSWTEAESDEDLSDIDEDMGGGHGIMRTDNAKIKRYEPYRNKAHLLSTLESLSTISTKRLSKKDRKHMHLNFADIRNSVEHPTWGPRYSTAQVSADSDEVFGSRLVVKVGKTGKMVINRWWKLHRWKALRRCLQSGFLEHYQNNEVVLEALPVLAS